MAPAASESKPMYQKDEKALCFHGELLYDAKVLEVRRQDPKDKNSPHEYRVHYKGWKNTWDDWVPQDRLRKPTDDNKELAANLRRDLLAPTQQKISSKANTSSKSRKQGSEFGSGRGSEERNSSVPAGGRGLKRGRDNDIEKVGDPDSFALPLTRKRLLEHTRILGNNPGSSAPLDFTFHSGFLPLGTSLGNATLNTATFGAASSVAGLSGYQIKAESISDSRSSTIDFPFDQMNEPRRSARLQKSELHSEGDTAVILQRSADVTRKLKTFDTAPQDEVSTVPTFQKEDYSLALKNPLKQSDERTWFVDLTEADASHVDVEQLRKGLIDTSIQSKTSVYSGPTIDEILARPTPPDEPEKFSKTTTKQKHKHAWAPLIGGTTQDEKALIEEELEAAGKIKRKVLYHPNYVKTRVDDPGNLNKMLFYQTVNPEQKCPVVGIAKDPFIIDPPGTHTPYDALKFPDRLVEHLNRFDRDTLIGWWIPERLLKIPKNLMLRIKPQVLAHMPDQVLAKQHQSVIDRLPDDAKFFDSLPANSQFKRKQSDGHSKALPISPASKSWSSTTTPVTSEKCTTCGKEGVSCHRKGTKCIYCISLDTTCSFEKEKASSSNTSPEESISTPKPLPRKYKIKREHLGRIKVIGRSEDGVKTNFPAGKTEDMIYNTKITFTHLGLGELAPRDLWALFAFDKDLRKIGPGSSVPEKYWPKPVFCEVLGQPKFPNCWRRANPGPITLDFYRNITKCTEPADTETAVSELLTKDKPIRPESSLPPVVQSGSAATPLPKSGIRVPNLRPPRTAPGVAADWSVVSPDGTMRRLPEQPKHLNSPTAVTNPAVPSPVSPTIGNPWIHDSLQPHDYANLTTLAPSSGTQPVLSGSQAYVSLPQEENFALRPSIRITIPDHLKNLLVDDWENVTKSLLLVPLPSQAPANYIIDCYFNDEKSNRRLGSAEAEVLEEFCAGMKIYFEKSVGKILLYRFERGQLADVRKLWESGRYPEWEGKGPGDCYGAEHLTRMLVNMPELIAQTNMDNQSVTRLKEEISKFCTYLARNSGRFYCAKYEKPSAEYIELAR